MKKISQLTSEEKEYLKRAKASPITFLMSKSEAEDAWKRIQSFTSQYSNIKLQTENGDLLVRLNTPTKDHYYGCAVIRTPIQEKIQISIAYLYCPSLYRSNAEIYAHILAHYIKTGELYPELLTNCETIL
jgi:hypothetical protein